MLESLWRTADCPACRQPGARVLLWLVKCRNTICRHFDNALSQSLPGAPGPLAGAPASAPPSQAPSLLGGLLRALSGTFEPAPADAIDIRYRNHKGEEKVFRGSKTSLRVAGRHITLCVAPKGSRISLTRDRILNLPAVEPAIPPGPYPDRKERRILLHGDPCSARYEELEKKFPDWE